MIEIKEIDHIYLYVSNLEESAEYYKSLFDLEFMRREDRDNMLMAENRSVHFFMVQDDSISHDIIKKQHLSFRVSSISEILEHLTGMGIDDYSTGISSCFKYKNYKWCEWVDLNGINIECIEYI